MDFPKNYKFSKFIHQFWRNVFSYQQYYEDYSFASLVLFELNKTILFQWLWKPAIEKRHVTLTSLRLIAYHTLFNSITASYKLGKIAKRKHKI